MIKYYEIHENGHNVRCKLFAAGRGTAQRAVIFFTGFGGHRDTASAAGFAEKLLSKAKDAAVVVFNWPAHGDDVKPRLTLEDCRTYLDLVVRDTPARTGAQTLFAYAVSFGAYVVLDSLSERGNPFRKIVLRSPAIDMYDVFWQTVMQGSNPEQLRKGKDVPAGFDRKVPVNQAFLEALKRTDLRRREFLDYADDLLILHGTKDEIVPAETSRSFAEDQVIEWVPVEGADHRFQNPVHLSLANKTAMQFFGFLT